MRHASLTEYRIVPPADASGGLQSLHEDLIASGCRING